MSELQFQSFVERYVATLFAQCRQIAGVFESADTTEPPQPLTLAPVEAPGLEVEPFLDFESISFAEKEPPSPDLPAALRRRPVEPPPPRSYRVPPNPWSGESEASRLQRVQAGVAAPRWARRRRGAARGEGSGGAEARSQASKDAPRRNSIRRASITSASSVMSAFMRNHGLHGGQRGQLSSLRRRLSSDHLAKEEKSEDEGNRAKSIFALPGEEDESSKVQKASKRRSFLPRGVQSKRADGRFGKTYSKAKRTQAQEVNRNMEAKLLERFRLAKEDDMEAAVPETSTNVLMMHQLAAMVALSFDDTRVAKAAFDDQDTQGKGFLEFEDFVQAVLDIHQNINSSCTPATLIQCEHLCGATFPAEEGSTTIDLVQFLQWYSTYSFHESLLLAPDMRDLRRLSRQYGIPWEVHNVKRHFDAVDTDGSGEIDFEEFSQVLRKVLQVAPELELPPNRARHFWKQLDTDSSGKADFSEFLPWWLKYFHHKEGKTMLVKPFEDFYRSVRTLKNPDPPPFKSKMKKMVFGRFEDPAKGAQKMTAERRLSAILTEKRLSLRRNSEVF